MNVSLCLPRLAIRRLSVVGLLGFSSVTLQGQSSAPPGKTPTETTNVTSEANPFDPARFAKPTTEYYYNYRLVADEPTVLFLPPAVPPLDAAIPLATPPTTGLVAPLELAPHVTDLFYPQLANRLAAETLTRKLRQNLEAYRAARTDLLDELLTTLARVPTTNTAERRRELESLGRKQAPALLDLENAAERLRHQLGGIPLQAFVPSQPARHDSATNLSPLFLHGAAFFLDGLSTDQRRLLLEIARAHDPALRGSSTLFRFALTNAGFQLPPDLPATTTRLLSDYTNAKQRIADELLMVLQAFPATNQSVLAKNMAILATRQSVAFAELAVLEDQLRPLLNAIPSLTGTAPTPMLPPELAARFTTYQQHKQSLLRELLATLNPSARATAIPGGKPGAIVVPTAAFSPAQQTALAELNQEKNALRAALAEHHRLASSTQDRKSVNDLLEDFERARQAQELREKYRLYRTALLEPGLTPAQRRLLCAAALQTLALPLPSGEVLPQP